MNSEEMVNEFLIKKFQKEGPIRWRHYTEEMPGFEKEKHLVECSSITVEVVDCGWDCGCYSCYTRDDSFDMAAHLVCEHDVRVRWNYGSLSDIPSFIKELDEYRQNNCRHNNECENC